MNKAILGSIVVAAALLLGGCATGYDKYLEQVQKVNQSIVDAKKAAASADETRFMALAYTAKTATDAGTKQMAVMGIAMARSSSEGGGNAPQMIVPQPPQNEALQWAQLIIPGGTNVAGAFFNYKLGAKQSDNNTALGIVQSNNTAAITNGSYNALQATAANGFAGMTRSTELFATNMTRPNEITNNGNGNGVQIGGGSQTVDSKRNCISGNPGNGANGGNGGTGASSAGAAGGASAPSGAVTCN